MARRLSQVASLIEGFNNGYDTLGRVMRDRDLREVSTAKPTTDTGFTQAQGDQLRAASESGQYDVAWDAERGQYTVRPKAAPDMVGEVAPQQRTQFLGQTYDTPLDEQGVSRARQMAMAGVLEKHGDPTAGVRMRDMLRQGDIAEENLKITRQRSEREAKIAPLQIARLERDERQAATAEADAEAGRAIDADVGEWFKTRLKNPDGTDRPAKVEDHLAASQFRAAKLVEAGKVDQAGKVIADYNAQSMVKIQLDTARRNEALGQTAAALATGDLGAVKDFYNEFVPDGAKVVDVKRGPKGEIQIQRETDDGRKLPPVTMQDTGQLLAALNSFKDPTALYQWSQAEFRNNLALRADGRAAASSAREAATFAAGAGKRQLDTTLAALQNERLDPKTTPARRAEIDTLLAQGKGADANEPADVKLARVAMNAGMFTDMRDALTWAVRNKDASPDKVRADLYAKALQTTGSAEAARKATEEGMAYLYPQGATPPAPAAAGAAIPPPAQRKPGQTYNTPQGPMIWRGTGWEPVPR